jgi:hypothetical protein
VIHSRHTLSPCMPSQVKFFARDEGKVWCCGDVSGDDETELTSTGLPCLYLLLLLLLEVACQSASEFEWAAAGKRSVGHEYNGL